MIIRMVTIPYGTENQLGAVAPLLVHVTAAGKGLGVVGHLLDDVIDCQGVDVDIALPYLALFIGRIDGGVSLFKELSDVFPLNVAQFLGGVGHDPERFPVSLGEDDVSGLLVVVDFKQPATRDVFRDSIAVFLLDDVDTVFCDTDLLGQEIEADVLAIQHDLDGFHVRIPGHAHATPHFIGQRVLNLSFPAERVGQQYPVAAGRHP